jgi:hypothetical protein
MVSYDPRKHEAIAWLRAFLGTHAARLRAGLRAGDRGASAVELAIITAVLVGLAAAILVIIINFVNKQGNSIKSQVVPSP